MPPSLWTASIGTQRVLEVSTTRVHLIVSRDLDGNNLFQAEGASGLQSRFGLCAQLGRPRLEGYKGLMVLLLRPANLSPVGVNIFNVDPL